MKTVSRLNKTGNDKKSRPRRLTERCPVCDIPVGEPCEKRFWNALDGFLTGHRTWLKAPRPHRIKKKR